MDLEYVEADGSWYDIGFAEGQAQRCMVKYVIYRYACYHSNSSAWRVLDKVTEGVEEFLRSHHPEEWDELRGIADGAGVDLPLLVACNFPYAVSSFIGKNDTHSPLPREQCSNIIFPTSEWGPLLGGCLDDDPLRFMLAGRPTNGIDFCCVMFPGWVACTWGGMNAAGLAVCGASSQPLLKKNKRSEKRVFGLDMLHPMRVLLRSCRTVDEALERMAQSDLWAGDNYSIMDSSGRGVQVHGYVGNSLELRVVEMPEDRGICCGNFFTWEIIPEDFDRFPGKQDVFSRYSSLKRAVDGNLGAYSVDAMKAVLTSHEGDPKKVESVCNDGNIVSMIAAPTIGKLLFATRPACVQGFKEYPITGSKKC